MAVEAGHVAGVAPDSRSNLGCFEGLVPYSQRFRFRPIPDIGSTGLDAQKLTLIQSSNEADVAAGLCSR